MNLRLFTLLTICAFTLSLHAQQNHQVEVASNFFAPRDLTINVGDTVTWTKDGGFHNVNGAQSVYPNNPEGFRNGDAGIPPFTFQFIFTLPGLYEYQCDPHVSLDMLGTVNVLPSGGGDNNDIVITEIMYNSPAGDDFEFVELYNKGTDAVDLTGWSFTQGFGYTFGAVSIGAGEYLVISEDSLLMLDLYGVTGLEWTDGGLTNGGEDIVLTDANGVTVDSVDYDDGNGWTMTADGDGPSLVLCDVEADNAGPENWERAITYAGYIEECKEVYANPGAASNCATIPVLSLELTCFEVNEDVGLVFVDVLIDNPRDVPTQVEILLNSDMSTATNGEDFDFSSPAMVFFPEGTDTAQTVVFQIIDDDVMEGDETIVLNLNSQTDDVVLATTTLTITIGDNDVPLTNALTLTGVYDGPLTGGVPKGIEIYANQDIADLSNFGVGSANNGGGSDNQEYTFPAVAVTAGTYVYVVNDSAGFSEYFGFFNENVFVDNGSAVNINGDDAVELFESNQVIDVFGDINVDGSGEAWEYLDSWAYRKSGTGPDGNTFILDNWFFGGVDNFDGTTANADAPNPFPIGTYAPTLGDDIVANDDVVNTDFNTSVTFDILSNDIIPDENFTLEVPLESSLGTIDLNGDFTITYTPNPDECGTDSFEYLICDANGCDMATVTVNIACPVTYPSYDIATVTTEDENGVADSLGVTTTLQGIVHGIDFRGGTGMQFTMIDATGGVAVFSFDIDYYDVTEGDEIMALGSIGQFNGLTQMNPDTVILVSSGNALQTPNIVTTLDEGTESQMVKLENLTLVDPAEWTNDGPGFNVNVTDGTNTYLMRIDNDTDIYGTPAPDFAFHLTGIGSQFDGEMPFTEGYQVYPRYLTDIEMITSVANPLETGAIRVYPNPTNDNLNIEMDTEAEVEQMVLRNVLGQIVQVVEKPNGMERLSLEQVESGVYWLSFEGKEEIWTTKVIKD